MLAVSEIDLRVRRLVRDQGRLGAEALTLDDRASLFDAGLTSHASVNLLIALEAEFGVEFPDAMLTREVFESVASLRTAIAELKSAAAA